VVALTYDPQAKKLFTICVDGVPRIWMNKKMMDLPSHSGIVLRHPFAWFSGDGNAPVMGIWERQDNTSYQFTLVSVEENGSRINLDSGMQSFFDGFLLSRDKRPGPDSVKIASDKQMFCMAGMGVLIVARLTPGLGLERVAHLDLDAIVSALDISADDEFMVFGMEDGSVFKWHYTKDSDPVQLVNPGDQTSVTSLFIGPDSQSLAVLFDPSIALFELDGAKKPKLFNTHSERVRIMTQSHDRSSLLVATEDNTVMLFDFGMRI